MKKTLFYFRLAAQGLKKNYRLTLPWLLAASGMTLMFYLVAFLSDSDMLTVIRGGDTVRVLLALGRGVISVFSVIFLFYTHAFLIRRRMREFGLYNVLGMRKIGLARVLLWETLMLAGLSLLIGLGLGIAVSRAAELLMGHLLHAEEITAFSPIHLPAVTMTAILFLIIFALIYIRSLMTLGKSTAVDLLKTEAVGERPPKANWSLALIGSLLLIAAYAIALTITDPLQAVVYFFGDVILVVIATYILFVAGSVALCRGLMLNKRYYYQPRHFISVSSMAFRMKRNGAGLASICILCTMVLVMLSSTLCLNIGMRENQMVLYPRQEDVSLSWDIGHGWDEEAIASTRELIVEEAKKAGTGLKQVSGGRVAELYGTLARGVFTPSDLVFNAQSHQLSVVSLQEYNAITGKNERLNPDEALYMTRNTSWREKKLAVENVGEWTLRFVDDLLPLHSAAASLLPVITLVVPDANGLLATLKAAYPELSPWGYCSWFYVFDTELDEAGQIALRQAIRDRFVEEIRASAASDGSFSYSFTSAAANLSDFYSLYGGLLYLGVLLSVVFLAATVLIIYYKQLSEGFEDRERFSIMRKVGMTRDMIRQSVNAQVLTVFFAPLVMAGLHMCFAFPLIRRMLMAFGLANAGLLALVTGACFLLFGALYLFVYRATSHLYYQIVSDS